MDTHCVYIHTHEFIDQPTPPSSTPHHTAGTIGAVQLDAALLACHTAGEDSGQPLAAPANTLPSSNNTAIYLGGALCASSTLGSVASPLTFFYGHDNLGKNPELYKTHVGRLAACVDQRMEADKVGG